MDHEGWSWPNDSIACGSLTGLKAQLAISTSHAFFAVTLNPGLSRALSGVQESENGPDIVARYFTYQELHQATGGFDRTHKIGYGGSSVVYRGKLKDGTKFNRDLPDRCTTVGVAGISPDLSSASMVSNRTVLEDNPFGILGHRRAL
jgi:hypothetical protein